MTLKLINTATNEELKALRYAPPKKFTPVQVRINGEVVDARYTEGRGSSYTYFPVNGQSFYAAGKLADDVNYTLELPEGADGPKWDVERTSTYVPKRKPKVKSEGEAAEGEQTTGEADVSTEGVPASEGVDAQAEAVAPKARRKRGE